MTLNALCPVTLSKTKDIKPKIGKIIIYTSGCPKNQNKCWNNTTSPPQQQSKKLVFKFLSNKIKVTPPAKTGKNTNNKILVKTLPHKNKFKLLMNFFLEIQNVPIIFKLFKILEIPNKCTEKIAISIENPGWKSTHIRLGYNVHPVPTPSSINILETRKITANIKFQKLTLFNLGNNISGYPIIIGIK